MIAMESLPPALRVQTEADASVHGVAAATSKPIARFSPRAPCSRFICRRRITVAHIVNGSNPKLMEVANRGAAGRFTVAIIMRVSRGNAMMNRTAATMVCRNPGSFASGSSQGENPMPMASTVARANRNQRRLRIDFTFSSFPGKINRAVSGSGSVSFQLSCTGVGIQPHYRHFLHAATLDTGTGFTRRRFVFPVKAPPEH